MYTRLRPFIAGALILLTACTESADNEKDVEVIAEVENNYNSDEYDFVLPQPISLAKAFQAAGLEYFPGITNPVSNSKNYNDKVSQLLNLGVYSTDLAYCALNGKTQDARSYLKAVQDMGNQVGLKPVFSDRKIIEKFDSNLNNMEAIEDLIYEVQERSEAYMEDNDIRYLSIVQFSGAWTEGMYLGVRDIELRKVSSQEMIPTIVDQISLLKNMLIGIQTYPSSDQKLTEVTKKLNEILSLYSGFESVKAAQGSNELISPQLSEEEFKQFAEKITLLRTYITS
ncbi:MAG: hypothetical protein EP338_10250 [Bacteroidetes bacterium]|nr:MAG: hypothetical protein EP338_10250 [Bacteroidota bacterium]